MKAAKEIKKKDFITLDCGYGPHHNDETCEVMDVHHVTEHPLFGNPGDLYSFLVRILGGDKREWWTIWFKPDDPL